MIKFFLCSCFYCIYRLQSTLVHTSGFHLEINRNIGRCVPATVVFISAAVGIHFVPLKLGFYATGHPIDGAVGIVFWLSFCVCMHASAHAQVETFPDWLATT